MLELFHSVLCVLLLIAIFIWLTGLFLSYIGPAKKM